MKSPSYTELKAHYLKKFRECLYLSTLETVYRFQTDTFFHIPPSHRLAYESAADHRRAEIVSNQLWEKVPAEVWRNVM